MANFGNTFRVINKAVKVGMQAASEPAREGRFVVAEKTIVCTHCGSEQFAENPSGVGLFVRGFSNASILVCLECSNIEIFLKRVSRIREKAESAQDLDQDPHVTDPKPEQ